MQIIYLILCIMGTALPLAHFIPWLANRGLDFPLLIQEAFATQVSAFAWSDVLVTAVAFIVFAITEGLRLRMRHWWVSICGLTVGVYLALPLFLLLRERHLATAPRDKSRRTHDSTEMLPAAPGVAWPNFVGSGPATRAGSWILDFRDNCEATDAARNALERVGAYLSRNPLDEQFVEPNVIPGARMTVREYYLRRAAKPRFSSSVEQPHDK